MTRLSISAVRDAHQLVRSWWISIPQVDDESTLDDGQNSGIADQMHIALYRFSRIEVIQVLLECYGHVRALPVIALCVTLGCSCRPSYLQHDLLHRYRGLAFVRISLSTWGVRQKAILCTF